MPAQLPHSGGWCTCRVLLDLKALKVGCQGDLWKSEELAWEVLRPAGGGILGKEPQPCWGGMCSNQADTAGLPWHCILQAESRLEDRTLLPGRQERAWISHAEDGVCRALVHGTREKKEELR